MPVIQLRTLIQAPIAICFDLARDVGAHQASAAQTRERAIAGRLSGCCEAGDTITWEAVHFGIRQRLKVRIVSVNFPHDFVDEMEQGIFRHMHHRHVFREEAGMTVMEDIFDYRSPLGILGRLADFLFVERHMRNFLTERNRYLKAKAEEVAGLHPNQQHFYP